jgi:phage FluMu protein Com
MSKRKLKVVEPFDYKHSNWNYYEPCPKCKSLEHQSCYRDGGRGFDPDDTTGKHLVYNTVRCCNCGILLMEYGNCRFGYDFKYK